MRIVWTEDTNSGEIYTELNGIRITRFADLFSVLIVDSSMLPTGRTEEFASIHAAFQFINNGGAIDRNYLRSSVFRPEDKLISAAVNMIGELELTELAEKIDFLSPSELRELNRALSQFSKIANRLQTNVINRSSK